MGVLERIKNKYGIYEAERLAAIVAKIKADPAFHYFEPYLPKELSMNWKSCYIYGAPANCVKCLGDVLAYLLPLDYYIPRDATMPEITDYLLALGIVVSPNAADKYVTYYFEMLPEISLSAWGSSSASHIAKNVVALFTELVRRYYTPYVEEAVLLKTIKILPQPIEEAISDCAWGVIARRYKGRHGTTCYSWTSKEAWDYDAYVTYRDMYGDFPWLSPQMPRRESWEASAIELRAKELESE